MSSFNGSARTQDASAALNSQHQREPAASSAATSASATFVPSHITTQFASDIYASQPLQHQQQQQHQQHQQHQHQQQQQPPQPGHHHSHYINSMCLGARNYYEPAASLPYISNQHRMIYTGSYMPAPPPSVQSYRFDTRLTNDMSGMHLNAHHQLAVGGMDNYIGSISQPPPPPPSINYSAYNTSDTMNHMMLYRENDTIERLKMKVLTLEQQLQSKNPTTEAASSSATLSATNPFSVRNENISNSSNINNQSPEAAHFVDSKLEKLEQTLNQREYEIEELKSKSSRERQELEKETTKYKSMLLAKEEEITAERKKSSAYLKESERLKSRLKDCENYVEKLPSLDESKDKDKKMNEINNENETLRSKIAEQAKTIFKAKQLVKDLMDKKNDMVRENESTILSRDKLQADFDSYKQATQSVDELLTKCKENASIRSQLESANEQLCELHEKIARTQAEHELVLNEAAEKMELEKQLNDSLRIEIENAEKRVFKLEKSLKEVSKQNQQLLSENLLLSEKNKSIENLMTPEALKQLHLLFSELSSCAADLNSLVQVCVDIYNGAQFDLCSLLGVSTTTDISSTVAELTTNTLAYSDYLTKKISESKQLRNKLSTLRKMISDQYADKLGSNLGSNMSCMMQ